MTATGSYTVFFDLDRTLTGMNSGYALVKTARKKGLIGKRELLKFIMMAIPYGLRIMPAEKIIAGMGYWLKGVDKIRFEAFAEEAAKEFLIGTIYPAACREIEKHRSKGASVVMLSSAMSSICGPVARHLGINAVLSTEMEVINGTYTGNPYGGYCFGAEKRKRAEEYCNIHGHDRKYAYYYADSFADIPALETVGNPVCINPDRRLKKTARMRKWPVYRWTLTG